MKKLLAILLTLSLAVVLAACGGPSDDEIKAVRNVSFEGTELTVTLGTNKSTGYEWDYAIFGDCVEPSIERTFKVTGSKGDATGELSIGFAGVSEGAAVIVFTTPNGWNGTGVGDSYTVNVVTGADGTIEKANGMEGAFPAATPEPTATPVPEPKTTLAIAELAQGVYTGTLSGDSWANNKGTMFTTIPSAELTVTVQGGQITLYCEAKASADGEIEGVATPHSPEYTVIVSGTLPLAQSSDTVVSAEGEVSMLGESLSIHYNDGKFTRWEVKERSSDSTYCCTVSIAMINGIPVAVITVEGKLSHQTATVPLGLKGETASELLSTPYADMLKSGNYQYSYPLTHQGIDFIATIAVKDGMACRKVVSEDGAFNQRVLSKGGKAYQIDDLRGAVKELGAEEYETPPDYAGTLTFVAAKTLKTGAVAEAYDFEYEGKPCNVVFVFSEGKLVEFVTTVDGATAETFVTDMTGAPDAALFEMPQ